MNDKPPDIAFYDSHFKQLHNSVAEDYRWSQIHKKLVKLSLTKSSTILDLGCSSGWLSHKLTEFGNVTGVDFSEQSIIAAKKQYPDIDFRTMDITTNQVFELGKGTFDLIVSSEVMEHITDHLLYITQITLLLKKSGTLILTTPNGKWYNHYFTPEMQPYRQPIENWITGNNLKSLLGTHFHSVTLKTFYANWIYSSRHSTLLKLVANDYIRALLKKTELFKTYLRLLEKYGFGLYLLVVAEKN